VKSYAAIWGDEEHPDWYGTWFTRDTDFALDWYNERPWLYDHTMNSFVGAAKIGSWKDADLDDHGLFFLGELDSHFRYLDEVEFLMELGYLFPSSGTLSHAMQVADDGWIRRWPVAELSSTTQPAEFRIPAQGVDASSRRRAAEAIRRLGGLTMTQDVHGALFPGADLPETPQAEPGTPARAIDEPVEEPVDAVIEVEAEPESEPEDGVEAEPQDEVTLAEVQSAILSVDGVMRQAFEELRALREEYQELQDRVATLEVPAARQVSNLVADPHWTDRLFCATRSGRAIRNADVGNDGDPETPLPQGDPVLASLGQPGASIEGLDVLSQIVASQQQ
jgi:hypothetical protein